jgi:hypothetical protein
MVISWSLIRVFWGEKISKRSLLFLVPVGLFGLFAISLQDTNQQTLTGIALSTTYVALFSVFTFIVFAKAALSETLSKQEMEDEEETSKILWKNFSVFDWISFFAATTLMVIIVFWDQFSLLLWNKAFSSVSVDPSYAAMGDDVIHRIANESYDDYMTLLFIFGFITIAPGYYSLIKWLFGKREEVGNWVDDYLVDYSLKLFGVLLLSPFIILAFALFTVYTILSNKSGSIISSSSSDSSYVRIQYQAQVRGGISWLNIGGPRNEDGAIRSVDYEKSRNPNKQYRVVELKNGSVGSTVYSC